MQVSRPRSSVKIKHKFKCQTQIQAHIHTQGEK